MSLIKHVRSIIFRRHYKELERLISRTQEIVPREYGLFNATHNRYTFYDHPGHILEYAAIEDMEALSKYQGHDHDGKFFDEVTNFVKEMVLRLIAWARTDNPNQKVTVGLCGNPPTRPEGFWIVERYAPWLDARHPDFPVPPGDIRYFATIDDVDTELEDGVPFLHKGERIRPLSRTFIRALVGDNPVYLASGYRDVLLAQPEPFRSQLLYGDFSVGMEDDAYQVIPTAWIHAAVERGRNRERPPLPITQVGVDVSRGGKDWTVFARRAGNWILPLERRPGINAQNGFEVAQHALSIVYGQPGVRVPICVDMTGGWGNGPYDIISQNWPDTYGVNANVKVNATDRSGAYKMLNTRAYLWWQLREMLDPDNTAIDERDRLILPDDPDLIVELATPHYQTRQGGWLQIESKDDIRKRIGRSTDSADALLLSLFPVADVAELKMRHLATDPREAAIMGVDMRGWDDD